MRRGSTEHRVDTDLWLCVLDLAAVRGWTPIRAGRPQALTHARPAGMTISGEEAESLAASIEALLPTIEDEQLPLGNNAFGEEHTESLLSRRVEGQEIHVDEARAARELLSGAPKRDAERLATFLKGGAFSVDVG